MEVIKEMLNNPLFIVAQGLGLIGLIVNVVSIQFKKKKYIVLGKSVFNICYGIQYLLLGSLTAFLTSIIAVIRNLLFISKKVAEKKSKIVLLIFLIIPVVVGIFTCENIIGVVPVINTMAQAYLMWQDDTKRLRKGLIIVYIMWLFYNIYIMAYMAFITTIFNIISTSIAMYRYDFNQKHKGT